MLKSLRAQNEALEAEKQEYYHQISNLKFCLTILHGQGLEHKKALKAERDELVEKKAALKKELTEARESSLLQSHGLSSLLHGLSSQTTTQTTTNKFTTKKEVDKDTDDVDRDRSIRWTREEEEEQIEEPREEPKPRREPRVRVGRGCGQRAVYPVAAAAALAADAAAISGQI